MQNTATVLSKNIMVEKVEIPEVTKLLSRLAEEIIKAEAELKAKIIQLEAINNEIEILKKRKQKYDITLTTLREISKKV